ncbi:ATP-dependent Clp protease ATP-binding subunit [Thermopolyspora sp. NPDC052614]|uniref:ATP-dependent Clp protease ATP-binding subunit n=1 Tax=Thermopolyspora sp. NPDC052614 TaxID=3155682 RepID=UPI0034471856
MATAPYGSIFGEEPFRDFDLLTGRLLGGQDIWPPSRPGVHRVDIGRLFSEAAREMLHRAAEFATERGAPDLDVLDLLVAAIEGEPTRAFLREAGIDREELAERIAAALPAGDGERRAPATLSPAAKRVFLDAQRIARTLRASYIGPEHLLLALAANPGSAAARVLTAAGVGPDRLRETVLAGGLEPGPAFRPETGTPTLDEYGRDLTEEAREGRLDPVVGREDEIEQVIEVLSRRRRNHPVLVGEPGVGKRAIVEGIAQRIVNGGVPEPLRGGRIVALDVPAMLGETSFRGEAEERVKKMIDEIRMCGDRLVIFIDDLHTVLGPGADGPLKNALTCVDLNLIAAATVDGHRDLLAGDPAAERRFQPIAVREPSVVDTVHILSCLRDRYEAHHQVRVTEDALDAAALLADRHICDRFLPDKAIDLMDQACARVRLRSLTPTGEILRLEDLLDALRRERDQAVVGEDYERAQELRQRIDRLWAELQEARHGLGPVPQVTARDVAQIVARQTGIPLARLVEGERERLLRMEECLHERVIGQDEAVRAVAESLRRARAGLGDPDRPIGAFLFLGPAGVGKAELARALAVGLFGGEDHLIHVDMGEYQEKSSVARLFGTRYGAPAGDDTGRLIDAVRRRPHAVLLLDEIEKAHPDVLGVLLDILRHGRLGVDFTHTIVIMTTAVGARMIGDHAGDVAELRRPLTDLLRRTLRPDLVDRMDVIDDIVIFRRLERDQVLRITALLLERTRRRLRAQNIMLETSDSVAEWLADRGHTPEHGARPLRRVVRRELEDRIAGLLLAGQIGPGDTVVVGTEDGELDIQVRMPLPRRDGGALPPRGQERRGGEQEPLVAGP